MDKFAKILVKARYILLMMVLVAAGICVMLMQKVNINSDMTKYLPDSSQMSQGITIMNDQFEETDSEQTTLKVMFDDLTDEDKEDMATALGKIKNVDMVEYTLDSDSYNKDNHTLYILTVDKQDNIEGVIKDIDALKDDFGDVDYVTYYNNMGGSLPPIMIIVLLTVVLFIMLVMCGSYVEPFLFLFTIGLAIVLNMGTNALLSSVSTTTNGISSVLQLVLSMDYSIILSNRYRQACKKNSNHVEAMTKAIKESIVSVSSSAVTTIVGLLSLVFMSFKIGGDLGFVLAKGVFFSLVCVFTALPAIMLIFDKLVIATSKKPLTIPMKGMAKISFKARYILLFIFVLIFAGSFVGKFQAGIQYDMPEENEIVEIFPAENKIVVIYDNDDEDKMPEYIEKVEAMKGVTNVSAYANTLGDTYSAQQLASMFEAYNMNEDIVKLLIYDSKSDRSNEAMTIEQTAQLVIDMLGQTEGLVADSGLLDGVIDESTMKQINEYSWLCSKEALTKPMSSKELAELIGYDEKVVDGFFTMAGLDSCSIAELVELVNSPLVKAFIRKQGVDTNMINGASKVIEAIVDENQYSADEIYEFIKDISEEFGMDIPEELKVEYVHLLYEYHFAAQNYDESWEVTMDELFDTILNSENLSAVISDEQKDGIKDSYDTIVSAKSQLVGEDYSRAIITVNLLAGSDEMMELVGDIIENGKDFSSNYYIGNSVMAYEMEASFGKELNKITLITAFAIFIVVAISFKSIIVPIILVMVIQASVYVTMTIMGIVNYDMNYLALLIMQCILMGATVDYAIVFTNYYREKRSTSDVMEALARTYQSSIRTILTSGLIMAIATAVLGLGYHDNTVGPIVRIISAGVVCAMLLIIGFLPSILAVLDKFVVGNNKKTQKDVG